MSFSLPQVLRSSLARLALGLGLAALVALLPLAPARADAPPRETSPVWQQLHKELASLQGQQGQQGLFTIQQAKRLADLSRLDTALGDSSDPPTIENATPHNLGVFLRSKRQAADQPASFAVLGAGQETDDDYEAIALFLPANVPVSWPGREPENGSTAARVARLLPGQELRVSDAEGAKGYALNLPAFVLETEAADLGALPSFTREELDAQRATAPVD